jgi:hypothetical protein
LGSAVEKYGFKLGMTDFSAAREVGGPVPLVNLKLAASPGPAGTAKNCTVRFTPFGPTIVNALCPPFVMSTAIWVTPLLLTVTPSVKLWSLAVVGFVAEAEAARFVVDAVGVGFDEPFRRAR